MKIFEKWLHRGMAAAMAVALLGCTSTGWADGNRHSVSLYQRLGSTPGITAVVDQFVANVGADERINHRFATTDLQELKRHLVNQICEATGGPCTYKGRTMKATHAGMGITNAEFDALVQDLVAALKAYKVPAQEQQALLSLLGPPKRCCRGSLNAFSQIYIDRQSMFPPYVRAGIVRGAITANSLNPKNGSDRHF
jgi:hemoglobin